MVSERGLSERRACWLVGLWRSTYRRRSVRSTTSPLSERLRALAGEWPRYGYRRLHVLLRREGWRVNHKRVLRLYQAEDLAVRRRRRKRVAGLRALIAQPTRANERWSMDFVTDALGTGRSFRVLSIVDDRTRECLVLEPDTSLPGSRVVQILSGLVAERGRPTVIVSDNGPEFAGRALDQWAYQQGVRLHFIEPGKPIQNAYVESFQGKLRDECLNGHWFVSLADARQTLEAWRVTYNRVRPHSALGYVTPEEFARAELNLEAVRCAQLFHSEGHHAESLYLVQRPPR